MVNYTLHNVVSAECKKKKKKIRRTKVIDASSDKDKAGIKSGGT